METYYDMADTATTSKLNNKSVWGDFLKRALDIVCAALGLLFLSPFFAWIAIRLKQEDPGPVFFHGPRVGKGGKVFLMHKFRTMYDRPESYRGARVTAADDQRVTPLGRWLRDTKLNELPQLWNVLVGEMSLVGPRPEDPQIAADLPEDFRAEIFSVRPGITSPASIAYRDEEDLLAAENVMDTYFERILPDKMRLDLLYVRHHNLLNDLDTIFWTFVILLPRIGKQKIQEGWLFDGPLARFFRHYASWSLIDFLIAFAGISIVGLLWRAWEPLDVGVGPSILLGVILALSFSLINTLLGLKMVSWERAAAEDAFRLVLSCGLVAVIYLGVHFLTPLTRGLPPSFVLLTCLVVLAGFVVARYRLRLLTGLASRWIDLRKGSFGVGERVLIIGAGRGGEFAAWMLGRDEFRHLYQVLGYVDDDPQKQGVRFDGLRVLGTTADLKEVVKKFSIGVLFFAISKIKPQDRKRILTTCRETGLPIVLIPDIIENVRASIANSVRPPEFKPAVGNEE